MKAVVENLEPVIRPVTIRPAVASAPRRTIAQFVPARVETNLFHAWRA
jgi:hypothetical protein